MAVWIDPPTWPAHGRLFSHLVSDSSYAELHEVAARAGIPPRAFDGDHYDVIAERYADAVGAGAKPTSGAQLMRRLNASGLRLRKRKGDRGIARLLDQQTPWGRAHLDIVVTNRPLTRADASALLIPDDSAWGVPVQESARPTDAAVRAVGIQVSHLAGYLRVTPLADPTPRLVHSYAVTPNDKLLTKWWPLFLPPHS